MQGDPTGISTSVSTLPSASSLPINSLFYCGAISPYLPSMSDSFTSSNKSVSHLRTQRNNQILIEGTLVWMVNPRGGNGHFLYFLRRQRQHLECRRTQRHCINGRSNQITKLGRSNYTNRPPFGHFEYLNPIRSNELKLCTCASIHSYYSGSDFLV